MRIEPLFIRLANREISALEVIQSVIKSSEDPRSIEIAQSALQEIPDLSVFVKDFKEVLMDISDNGISQRMINYLNSYMKPSLSEILDTSGGNRSSEKRYICIKDPKAPWVEGIVCYNLSLFIKAFGLQSIKNCPVCTKFFTNKGKYAKYCSDICKTRGSN